MDANYLNSLKQYVHETWSKHKPEYFISMLWTDHPRRYETVTSHTKHFKNILLCDLYNLNKCSDIPDATNRVGMTVFHERKLVIMPDTFKQFIAFHTHIHLFNLNTYLKILTPYHIQDYLQFTVGRRIKKLSKECSENYKGVDVKVWNSDHHMNYNFKDYHTYKYKQDSDLPLDLINSDFVC